MKRLLRPEVWVPAESRVVVPLADMLVRDSGAGDGSYTIKGHAAVYNKKSLDLGGFREIIAPTAFDRVLGENPDVLAVWDHDTRYVIARTLNNTLELRSDPYGLHAWMRAAPTSWAPDLRIGMERGDITQASFMFTIAREAWEWSGEEDDPPIATVQEVQDLYDVTVTARGAYPQTDMSVVQGRTRLLNALQQGAVPGLTLDMARERGFVTEDPEPEPVEPAGEEGDAERVASEVAAREQAHRVAVEHAKRRRAGANRPR